MFKKSLLLLVVISLLGCLTSCMSASDMNSFIEYYPEDSESYLELEEKGFVETSENNKVNVSLDSSTAAYSNLRRVIKDGGIVHKDMVNIEQMINYFNYSYVNDTSEQLTSFLEIGDCPWNENNKLLSVAIKAKDFELNNNTRNNFVFLLDVSGSMYSADKLPLMVESFKILIDSLKDDDRISIVTYASREEVLLDGGYGYEKNKISAIISDLEAGGATAGSDGIKTAYKLAEKYYIEGGNNRVFLATDGDFNVGISSIDGLERFIEKKRESGVYLSLFGFGTGNLHSSTMDTLASAGNGNYYYIDSILEARKVFIETLGGTLMTLAKDAKAQVEFNSEIVEKYRVIGYENKMLTNEEFDSNETDAGEIGAGHTVICLIEVVLKDDVVITGEDEIVKSTLRYKDVLDAQLDKEVVTTCNKITSDSSNDFVFASAVAEFGLILRDSKYKADASYDSILSRVNNSTFTIDVYKKEFCELVQLMNDRQLAAKAANFSFSFSSSFLI